MDTLSKAAKKIIKLIEQDITDRSGIGNEWETIDDECKKEIRDEWQQIIVDEISFLAQDGNRPTVK